MAESIVVHLPLPPDPRDPPVADPWQLAAQLGEIHALVRAYGAPRVRRWVETFAALEGQEVS